MVKTARRPGGNGVRFSAACYGPHRFSAAECTSHPLHGVHQRGPRAGNIDPLESNTTGAFHTII